jgi:hypothetical protein
MRSSAKTAYRLSKTDFLQYLKCPPEFWLAYHEPLLFASEVTLERQHLRQQGYAVEQLVKQMQRFREDACQLVDFQRTFQTAQLASRSDIVVTDRANGELEIYEIKSSSSVKAEHYDDVAFQVVTARKMGHTVRGAYVITLNSDYVRRGELDVEQLFVIHDITQAVDDRVEFIEAAIKHALEYLGQIPMMSLADYCMDNKLDCRFLRLQHRDLPEYTVFDISFLKHDRRRALLNDGILAIRDVPDDFKLNKKQRLQVAVAKSGEIIIDRDEIARRFDSWEYPLHFLDYETFAYAIPQFDGIRPFQQMCFQYSLHTMERPGAPLRHTGYLSRGVDEPPRCIAEHLRDEMTQLGIGTVFVWYEPFEKGRNAEMGEMYPDLAPFFQEVNERTYDLMRIFSDDLYVHPKFRGKTSIKKVLPVLVPWLNYDELGIGDGLTATIQWYRGATWTSLPESEREKIFNDLWEYCELDTKAMVEIYNVLRSLLTAAPSS